MIAGFTRIILIAGILLTAIPAVAQDRHSGYYYPAPTSTEVYIARTQILEDSDKRRRIGFIVGLTDEQIKRNYAPDYAIFAKGENAEKLIIISMRRDFIASLYQARGFLAQLTAQSRGTELFRQLGVEESFTFWDLVRMLGFEMATVSNGIDYTHQVTFE